MIPATREKIEFDHLVRVLSGLESTVQFDRTLHGRIARSMFEYHLAEIYDRPGCFGYVGWRTALGQRPPSRQQQLAVFGAFARGAVAARVYLGALEPNEGFGLVKWFDEADGPAGYRVAHDALCKVAAYALDLLQANPGWARLNRVSIALGYGRLRGSALFHQQKPKSPGRMLLDGPAIVETIYGEVPNRCGGMAKGKDSAVKPGGQLGPNSAINKVASFRQSWAALGAPSRSLAASLLSRAPVAPRSISPRSHLKPFLIGFSLDFAQSSPEYARDAHLARTVVDRVLTEFEDLTEDIPGLFVSPRYGDGVAAVLALEARTPEAALSATQEWHRKMLRFCRRTDRVLEACDRLGLRLGMAHELDLKAVTPRLVGVGRKCSPAVEALADSVITRARRCHEIAKAPATAVPTENTVNWLHLQTGDATMLVLDR